MKHRINNAGFFTLSFKKAWVGGLICLTTLVSGYSISALASGGESVDLMTAPVNLDDKASLQRGARLFTDYCMGCHSLNYIRYERLTNDLLIPTETVNEEFLFGDADIHSQMRIAASAESQSKWFGVQPPDLTLSSRIHGPDWIYSYLLSFYEDPERPLGVNNHVFENVGMPHVMKNMQDRVSEADFKQAMGDITNFLSYTGDPTKAQRESIGRWVLIFLAVLFIPAWLLNREYWKNIH